MPLGQQGSPWGGLPVAGSAPHTPPGSRPPPACPGAGREHPGSSGWCSQWGWGDREKVSRRPGVTPPQPTDQLLPANLTGLVPATILGIGSAVSVLALQGEDRGELLVPRQLPFSALCSASGCWGQTPGCTPAPAQPLETQYANAVMKPSSFLVGKLKPCLLQQIWATSKSDILVSGKISPAEAALKGV